METKDRVKELIARAGMTQNGFADAYGIPKNTVHNWCQGVNEPPEYLLDLLVKDVEAKVSIPMAWVLTDYNGNVGDDRIFTDRYAAVEEAKAQWAHLSDHDKNRYMTNGSWFHVGLYEMEWDDGCEEYIPDFWKGPHLIAWDAAIEYGEEACAY